MNVSKPVPTLLAAAVLSSCVAQHATAATTVSAAALMASASLGASAVSNCNDSGNGSLRAALLSANDGDVIEIPTLSCTLTLTTGQLQSSATQVTIEGPPSRFHIDQSGNDRIISGLGSGGHLTLQNLYMTHGKSGSAGGCIFTFGNVHLVNSKVSGCSVSVTSSGDARGGAIYAVGVAQLDYSEVSGNTAYTKSGRVQGGGIWADGIVLDVVSRVAQNKAMPAPGGLSSGGGIYAVTNAYIANSHVSGNEASIGAGIFSNNLCTFEDSLIAGNQNAQSGAGAYCHGNTVVVDSTITGNKVASSVAAGGIFVYSGNIDIHNSIIAENVIASGTPAVDVAANGRLPLNASHSIVINSNLTFPPDTINADPKLDPVSAYPTSASPALGTGGTNPFYLPEFDVALRSRQVGTLDIGAYQETLFKGTFQ